MRRGYVLFIVFIAFIFLGAWGIGATAQTGITVQGTVLDEKGSPMAGATVRVKASANSTTSDAEGRFTLNGVADLRIPITAWKLGYYVRYAVDVSDPLHLVINMVLHTTTDDPTGPWEPQDDPSNAISCNKCMPALYEEWKLDAHSQTTTSPFVLSMYNGTDVTGEDEAGFGYKTDFPTSDGNCATCHAPGLAYDNPWSADLNKAAGIQKDGVFCYFCHSIISVNAAMTGQGDTGTLSIGVTRSATPSTRVFFGPFDDDDLKRAAKSPLQTSSQICAPCHTGRFWNVPIYQSFPEWQASPYPAKGIECQTCHMPAYTDVKRFIQMPEHAGSPVIVDRDPATIFSHLMPGSRDAAFLKTTFDLEAKVTQGRSNSGTPQLTVDVALTNVGAGHDAPTDSPFRNITLVVTARDRYGRLLRQTTGPVVPSWGGVGDPADGYLAGLPGRIFAKILQENSDFFHLFPTAHKVYFPAPQWRPVAILEDTRIHAMKTDRSLYTFSTPRYAGDVNIEVKVLFRRFFKSDMDAKGYDIPDIIMNEWQTVIHNRLGTIAE
jgi:hypothetical protein